MKWYKRLLGRPAVAPRDDRERVIFIHKDKRRVPNIGDHFCSPRHYFRFEPSKKLAAIGGGAFNDLAVSRAFLHPDRIKVSWGVGRSVPFEAATPLDRPAVVSAFDIASTRDPGVAGDGVQFVPCVSAFHAINEIPVGTERGLFLNADSAASGEVEGIIARTPAGFITGLNSLDEAAFTAAFARTGEIITNSYHVAYWGLLSGRRVTVLGYSSKFTSLFEALELNPSEVRRYPRGDTASLTALIEKEIASSDHVKLTSPTKKLREFRERNIDFAKSLVTAGLASSITPISTK